MLNKIYKNYDVNKKYAIRKFAVGTFSVAIGLLATNMNELPVIGSTVPNIVYASEVTNWQPEGNIIAQGEDGVPWELYENGYLLFKPTEGKDTLAFKNGNPEWRLNHASEIKAIGFTGKVYLPEYSPSFFSNGSRGGNGKNLSELEYIDTTKIDISKVENMSYLFFANRKIKSLDLSNWDTSKVKKMNSAFEYMQSLSDLNVENWNVSQVEDMESLFSNTNISSLNLSNWDVSNVRNLSATFSSMENLTNLNVSNWNTSKVTDMSYLFQGVNKLETLNINDWDTSKVTDMTNMFAYSGLTNLDLNNWDTSKVLRAGGMFQHTEKLINLNISNWDVSQIKDMSSMFHYATALTSLDLRNWNTSSLEEINHLFADAHSLKSLDLNNWNTSKITDLSAVFSNVYNLETLNINNWDTSKVTNMNYLFHSLTNLKVLNLNSWDTSKVENMSNTFHNLNKLEELNVSNWDTSKVKDFSDAISYLPEIKSLDLTNWSTESATNLNGFFWGLNRLVKLKLGESIVKNNVGYNIFKDLYNYFDENGKYPPTYTEKWLKEDKSKGPYSVNEWDKSYKENPQSMVGVWVREAYPTTYTINFISETNEKFEPLSVERNQPINFPVPKVDKPGYKFRGWAKQGETLPGYGRDENGNFTIVQLPVVYANGVSNLAQLGGSVNMIDIWDKVDPETVETEPVPYKKVYEPDETLDKGESFPGTWGMDGRKEIRKISKIKPITGELYDPVVTSEKIVTPPQNAIVYVGTKPKEETVEIPSPKKYVKDSTREKGADNIVENGKPGSKTITTTYTVNPENGDVTENVEEPVIVNPTETIVKVAAKDKVEIIKSNDKTIQRTTTYDVNPETGEITISSVTDKLISSNTPLIPNPEGADLPKVPEKNTNEKPEYTKPISTNSPTDDNGNLILPPVEEKPEFKGGVNSTEPPVSDKLESKPIENNEKPSETLINEKPEYKGPLSTNTPIDENGNLILPPTIEKPEFNGNVNSAEPPIVEKPKYTETISTNTPVDDNGNQILPPIENKPEYTGDLKEIPKEETVKEATKEETKVEDKKDKELPNTNSTSVIVGFVSSLIGALGLGYKSRRRK